MRERNFVSRFWFLVRSSTDIPPHFVPGTRTCEQVTLVGPAAPESVGDVVVRGWRFFLLALLFHPELRKSTSNHFFK